MQSKIQPSRRKETILGQPSWRLASSEVEAFVTEQGGHLGPVTFDRRRRKIQPFSVAPWAEEKADPKLPFLLKALRGDFFCLPFGGNGTPFGRERHPVHGETANDKWTLESLAARGGETRLHLSLKTKTRRGRVDKELLLREGHNAVYSRHTVSGMSGLMDLGHHAMLQFPDRPGSGNLSTSRFHYGQVFPGLFETPENGGYTSLQPGAEFTSLERVPTQSGGLADLTIYPARRGFEDLVMLVGDTSLPLAWTAVVFPQERYVWFALKDPRVLRQTVFWISNGGRHYPPWNSRHVNVMGLEEVTAYFHYGLAESVQANPISAKGLPTCIRLDPESPLVVNYIMAVAPVPKGFDRVVEIEPEKNGVYLVSETRHRVSVPLAVDFISATARGS